MHGLPWITIFVTSEVICQWFSRVTKSRVKVISKSPHEWTKSSLLAVTNILSYFLRAILPPKYTIPLKTIIDRSFRNCYQRRSFLTKRCDVTTFVLWRQMNARYWHCAVIFVDCSCTRKLAQTRSSLMNNNRGYLFFTTRYSRPHV